MRWVFDMCLGCCCGGANLKGWAAGGKGCRGIGGCHSDMGICGFMGRGVAIATDALGA